jgi:GSCFA family
MSMPKNPYESLGPEHFWKSGVCDRPGESYEGLWKPRFAFDTSTRFATAGSCFAQHIGKWLRENGYQWLASAASPASQNAGPDEGASPFSFPVGNIYTAAMLKQWVTWALGREAPPETLFCNEAAVYDPFVSHMAQRGFVRKDELYRARKYILENIRRIIAQTDIFIFTLGLTEGWTDRAGNVYPACPGTSRGVYEPAKHRFVNYGFAQIEKDLNETFDAMKTLNPSLRFLLTVSPVPLTATAGEDHVLAATTYSKSVLRAVAGQVRNTRDDVDYFPSYELISSFPERGRHFEKNLRAVMPSGVAFVMAHFADALQAGAVPERRQKPIPLIEADSAAEDALCDDLLLEKWQGSAVPAALKVCLVGDSHMEKLAKSLNAIGVEAVGGMIMNGSAWYAGMLDLHDSEIFVPLEGDVAREAWKKALPFFSEGGTPPGQKSVVITNLCMHTHKTVPEFLNQYHAQHGSLDYGEASMVAHFLSRFEKHLHIIRRLLGDGFEVIAVTDPPTQAINDNYRPFLAHFENYDRLAEKLLREEGCKVFNSRTHFCRPDFPGEFLSGTDVDGVRDYIHGSDLFYQNVAQSLYQAFLRDAA